MAGARIGRSTAWKLCLAACALALVACQAHSTDIIQTMAGGGSLEGYQPTQANLLPGNSQGLAVNGLGEVFVSDSGHHQVLKINPTTGLVTVVAGNGTACYYGDGLPAYSASLNNPGGLAFDSVGKLYIADRGNYVIRCVDGVSGVISTVAGNGLFTGQVVGTNPPAPLGDGGPALSATFRALGDITFDGGGNLIVADTGNDCVRRVATDGSINTIAGTPGNGGYAGDGVAGGALATQFQNPTGVAVDGSGNIYIADSRNRRVRRLDPANTVVTVAGDGTGGDTGFSGDGGFATDAEIGSLGGLAFDASGNLLLSCVDAGRIRRADVASPTAMIVTIAGNGGTVIGDLGPATGAALNKPRDIALDGAGNLFIYDSGHGRVRRVDGATGFIDTVIGTGLLGFIGDRGPHQFGVLVGPQGADFDANGNLYIADSGDNAVRMVAPDGTITTLAGNGTGQGLGDGGPAFLATLDTPTDVVVFGTTLFICDWGNDRIRYVNLADANRSIGTYVELNNPVALAVDAAGVLYVARNDQVDMVALDRTVTTYVGSNPVDNATNPHGDGLPAANCSLNAPQGLFLGLAGELYIADTGNNLIRRISPAPESLTSTVAGGGAQPWPSVGDGLPATQAVLNGPAGVTLDPGGTRLIISDTDNHRIRAVDLSSTVISTIAGNGTAGFAGDGDVAATALVNFSRKALRYGPALVFADTGNNRIRKIVSAIDIPAAQLSFGAKLSFAIDKKTGQMVMGKDAVTLKAALPLPAGIAAPNLRISVDIIDLHQQVQLDAKGKQPKPPKKAKAAKVTPVFNFVLPHNGPPPVSKFSLSLKGTSVDGGKPAKFSFASKGTFREELGRAGFTNVDTPKEGMNLPVRVDITLGTTTFTGLTTVQWKAKQGKGGAAKSIKTK